MKLFFGLYCIVIVSLGLYLHQDSALTQSMQRGKEIYSDFCVTCHMSEGQGVAYTFPPLAKSDFISEKRTESLHAIKYGLQGEITVNGETYNSNMAPMGLEDEEIADVMNYIGNSWGNSLEKMVTPEEVASIKK
jgi:mono/diheme cytochrome c family protein